MNEELRKILLLDLRDVIESDYQGMIFDDLQEIGNDIAYQWIIGENRAKNFAKEIDLDILEVVDMVDYRGASYEELVNALVAYQMNDVVGEVLAHSNFEVATNKVSEEVQDAIQKLLPIDVQYYKQIQ